jgi:crotonobetainyl-CoA:carnitine CoA-transferase CaiB-like acyl-CoA transferase
MRVRGSTHDTLSGPEQFHCGAAPLLGEHNGTVLGELGFADPAIQQLYADGVIGHVPDMARR